MDKVTRMLILYSRLLKGHTVNKETFCSECEITHRSFDRDIEDIRLFLSESYSGYELKYDRKKRGYSIVGLNVNKSLDAMEIILLLTILKESRSLRQDEFEGLVESIFGVAENWKKQEIYEIADEIKRKYYPVKHKKALMKLFWDLQLCIHERSVILLKYTKRDGEFVKRRVYPLEIIFSEHYFYLIAMIKNEAYEYPAFYRLDRVDSFQVTLEHYEKSVKEKYNRFELEKKIKYMQGGNLLKITVSCENSAKENFLDTFEDSVILENGRENTIIQVETFEEGFLQWIFSQKGKVIVLEPPELCDMVCEILENTLKKYKELRAGGKENEDV